MSTFSERLQKAAELAGVGTSQAEIAAALGLNRQTVNRWFLGGEVSAENLLLIVERFRVRLAWLRDDDGEPRAKPAADNLDSDERELIRNYRSATPQQRRFILSAVSAARKAIVTIAAVVPPYMAAAPEAEAAMEPVAV